jgi:GNAT superfamily N-acetyltransferase
VRYEIRAGRRDDASALRAIENRAGERFREVGLEWVADDEPFTIDSLRAYAEAGRCWVAVDESGRAIGFVLVDVIDEGAHVEQVSVEPQAQGHGVGRALLRVVRRWADEHGHAALTLTTFDAVPWNRPLYEHMGFRVLTEPEIGPELRAVRATEAAHGLDRAPRVCMRLDRQSPGWRSAAGLGD